ncbi:MAG TPA: twin-arginine translocase subunit TatC [Candidatus Limnocylindrales bacterium]|nr:twin-arginine translocase subunit TatC [Candidatus Limnocylindrales bacterium]
MSELIQSPDDRAMHSPPAPPAPVEHEPVDRLMTLGEHLTELRRRLAIAILTVTVGSIIGFFLAPEAIRILADPILAGPSDEPLRFTQPAGGFMLQLKLALMIGIALGFPILLYQIWAFVSPGLNERERALARPWIPLALLFLVLGIVLAYTVLPYAVAFLLGFQVPGVVEPLITVDAYFGFVTTMFLAFSLVMQFPVAMILLARAGVISPDRLRRSRRYVVLGLFIVAVVVTPGDPFSSIILTLVMYPLYEVSIVLAVRAEKRKLAGNG